MKNGLLTDVLLVIVTMFCFLGGTALAQISPTASKSEKEKTQRELEKRVLTMLDQTVSDAGAFKLAQNRAVVYAIAGDLYWKYDEKRDRELFRNCGNEILMANTEAENEKREMTIYIRE